MGSDIKKYKKVNRIGIGDRIMGGSRLVELCDKLIDCDLNKMLL